ncbi:MAG: ATP-binding protein [Candidatus Heimdallarchaeota archaeon]
MLIALIEIERARCGQCFGCASVCPPDAIRYSLASGLIVEDTCNNCLNCLKVCPVSAITFKESPKSTSDD